MESQCWRPASAEPAGQRGGAELLPDLRALSSRDQGSQADTQWGQAARAQGGACSPQPCCLSLGLSLLLIHCPHPTRVCEMSQFLRQPMPNKVSPSPPIYTCTPALRGDEGAPSFLCHVRSKVYLRPSGINLLADYCSIL